SGMTVHRALAETSHLIEQINSQNPEREARWLLESVAGSLITDHRREEITISRDQAEKLNALIERRLKYEPLQYLLGTVDFRNININIDHRALIPRPETEGLIDFGLTAIRSLKHPRVLDVGTGSGVIALSLLDEHSGASAICVDNSSAALELAIENCQLLNCINRAEWLQIDLFSEEFTSLSPPPFDLIISNPPYVSSEEFDTLPLDIKNHEPAQALLAGSDGLEAIRRLAEASGALLTKTGTLVCEIGENHGLQALQLFRKHGWDVNITEDLSQKPRYLTAKLPAA
ncbi:peptide chain release factor N(5)-glutamine methyltransferase, partial [bacterium]|nr:peptide chain release factor N(5)-glutamine methyltransferase [bacterium]